VSTLSLHLQSASVLSASPHVEKVDGPIPRVPMQPAADPLPNGNRVQRLWISQLWVRIIRVGETIAVWFIATLDPERVNNAAYPVERVSMAGKEVVGQYPL
jgi:hypothetical protein